MGTNKFFNNYKSRPEQSLVESLITESIQIMGTDVYYLPMMNKQARDLIYGEDPLKTFPNAFQIEVYPKNTNDFSGDREFFSKFGLEIRNNITVVVSKRVYHQRVKNIIQKSRPMEGDLIYIPVLNGYGELYEIKFVNQTWDMAMLGRKSPFTYELELEKFKYSHEDISTGIHAIDIIQQVEAYAQQFTFNTLNNRFVIGEVVFQGPDSTWANATTWGTVVDFNIPNSTIKLDYINGVLNLGQIAYGNTSGANCIFSTVDVFNQAQNHADYDNDSINTESNTYIDFSESNPFGSI
jgi:hypothetical protein